MTIHIDNDKAIELLTAVVEERGKDFVYEPYTEGAEENHGLTCFYTVDGKPSCGVGLALFNAGVPISVLAEMDNLGLDVDDESAINSSGVLAILKRNGVEITDVAANTLFGFQVMQDMERPYGMALDNALFEH